MTLRDVAREIVDTSALIGQWCACGPGEACRHPGQDGEG